MARRDAADTLSRKDGEMRTTVLLNDRERLILLRVAREASDAGEPRNLSSIVREAIREYYGRAEPGDGPF